MTRLLWFAAGAGAGAYGLVKARRAAEALTPEGLSDRLAGLAVGLDLFRQEVRAGMDEKEDELRTRLAHVLQAEQQPQITSGPDRQDRAPGHPHHQKEDDD